MMNDINPIEVRRLLALNRALNAGCTITVDGKERTFTALDLGDLADIVQWQKDRQLASYLRVIKDLDIDRATRFNDMHDIQMRAARRDDFSVAEPATLVQMSWLSLRHAHQDITREQARTLIDSEGNQNLIVDVLGMLTVETMEKPSGDQPDPFEESPARTSSTSSP